MGQAWKEGVSGSNHQGCWILIGGLICSRSGKYTCYLEADKNIWGPGWEAPFTPTRTRRVGQPPTTGAQVKAPPLDYHHHLTFQATVWPFVAKDSVFPPAGNGVLYALPGMPGLQEWDEHVRIAGPSLLTETHNLFLASREKDSR